MTPSRKVNSKVPPRPMPAKPAKPSRPSQPVYRPAHLPKPRLGDDTKLGPEDTTYHWTKFKVTFAEMGHLVMAMPIAMALHGFEPSQYYRLYFARYTAPTFHVEYQVYSSKVDKVLKQVIWAECKKMKVKRPTIECSPCNGSPIHALAFKMALRMESDGTNTLAMISDVTHWLSNMLGFTYAQEAAQTLRHGGLCLVNALGGQPPAIPIFPNIARMAQKVSASGRVRTGKMLLPPGVEDKE